MLSTAMTVLSSPAVQTLLALLYLALAASVTADVLLTKSDVRGALGWIAAAWLSPILGGLLYFLFGINRVTRRALKLTRRFRKVAEGEGARPDILLIDGGSGQVAQALDVLRELGVDGIEVVGVAKGPGRRAGEETLVLARIDAGNPGRELHPGSSSPALHLVAAVRDEAHRFAISGHRKRREKARERSVLEDVPGIGTRRRSALLKAFGGMQGLERAGVEELMQVKGIDRGLAERIYASLHG